MREISLEVTKKLLTEKQSTIIFENDEDEIAFEFYAEICSVLECIDNGGTGVEVLLAAQRVGLDYLVNFKC